MPVGMALLAQTAGPRRVGRVMSVVGVPMLLGPILGPVIGGLIVSNVSWRWIFYVNVPIVFVALALAHRLLNRDSGRADPGPLDWRGFALLSPGLVGIVFGLSETEASAMNQNTTGVKAFCSFEDGVIRVQAVGPIAVGACDGTFPSLNQ